MKPPPPRGEIVEMKKAESVSQRRGLGDAVAAVAQPIARAIDRVAGTKIQSCASCKRRRDALNQLTQPKPRKKL